MSDTIEFACPHPDCGQTIRSSARYAGMEGSCPHCGRKITVVAPADMVPQTKPDKQAATAAHATDANVLLAGIAGAAATLLLYLVFHVARETYVGQLFTNRGPIPFIATFVTCWGLATLVLKYIAVKRQLSYAEKELEFIPLEAGMEITPQTVETFLQHLETLPRNERESILARRIRGALEHFRSRNSVPEVQSYLASHSEIDASAVDSGYTLLRAFIWVVPILGFIGTVMGISSAVSGLAGSLEPAEPEATASAEPGSEDAADVESQDDASTGSQMIEAMGLVTQGLATAFDTTFLALVMAIFLLFPTEILKRIEFRMLDRVEAFTNEYLLRRMSNEEQDETLMPELAKMLDPAFRRHQQWLVEWENRVTNLGSIIGKEFETHANKIQEQLKSAESGQIEEAVEVLRSLSNVIDNMNGPINNLKQVSVCGVSDYLSEFVSDWLSECWGTSRSWGSA